MTGFMIYCTAGSREEAETIAVSIVEEGLVACVNLIDGMTSVYRWQGAVETSKEVVIIGKTDASRVEVAVKRIAELHSYDCPCVVTYEMAGGWPPYLDWISEEASA